MHRIYKDEFLEQKSTIGFDHINIDRTLVDQTISRLEVWDTAGSEAFSSMNRLFYRDASAVIVCFKLTDKKSFESVPKWVDEINDLASD